jgi:acetyl esterase/lipase
MSEEGMPFPELVSSNRFRRMVPIDFPFNPRTSLSAPLLAALTLALIGPDAVRAAEADSKPEVRTLKDLSYYDGADRDKVKHQLDLYLPDGKKDFPVLMFVHGGAWVHGDKNFLGVYSALGKVLARQGIGAVVINYRLSPGVKHPEHIKDVARAFSWVHKNIGKHGGRADSVFLCGHSAGAHLIALLATDETYLKAEGLSSKDIRGVVPISGPFLLPDRFMPHVFGSETRQASPMNHVRANLPPFLILYADKDFSGCDRKPAEAFRKALADKGNTVRSEEFKDQNHFSIIGAALVPDNLVHKAIVSFVRTYAVK